jgi:hypothetical protein
MVEIPGIMDCGFTWCFASKRYLYFEILGF